MQQSLLMIHYAKEHMDYHQERIQKLVSMKSLESNRLAKLKAMCRYCVKRFIG